MAGKRDYQQRIPQELVHVTVGWVRRPGIFPSSFTPVGLFKATTTSRILFAFAILSFVSNPRTRTRNFHSFRHPPAPSDSTDKVATNMLQ